VYLIAAYTCFLALILDTRCLFVIAISSHHLSEFEGCAATVVSPILVSLWGEREIFWILPVARHHG